MGVQAGDRLGGARALKGERVLQLALDALFLQCLAQGVTRSVCPCPVWHERINARIVSSFGSARVFTALASLSRFENII